MKIVTRGQVIWAILGGLALLYAYALFVSESVWRDRCSDRGGCWDTERRGCVFVKVPFRRELEPTPYQEATGSCRAPPRP